MLAALASSAAGIRSGAARLDRAAHEIANVNTNGHRASGAVARQGALQATGNPLDLAVQGAGWFRVAAHDGRAFGEVLLTRAGAFHRDAQGFVSSADGRYVVGWELDASGTPTGAETRLRLPLDTTSTTVDRGGVIRARTAAGAEIAVGAVSLATVANPDGLQAVDGALHRPTPSSGPAVTALAGGAAGTIESGVLESSTADLASALVETLLARHDVRANTRSLEAADEILRELTRVDLRA